MRRAALVIALLAVLPVRSAAAAPDLARFVNPFNGTQAGAADFGTGGGAGNTFPGATLPFGMVQFSPDTSPSIDAFGGGYSYVDKMIKGFSLKHMSGPGCAAYQDIPITPTTAPVRGVLVKPESTDLADAFTAAFDHAQESAAPGDYRVKLGDGTDVQLTATTRAGLAQLRFPAGKRGSVLVNAAGAVSGTTTADVAIDPAKREISGSAGSGNFCYAGNTYRVYFAARFSKPFSAYGTWKRELNLPGTTEASDSIPGKSMVYTPIAGGPNELKGQGLTAQTGGYASFDDETVDVRVGVSFVSVDGARANLEREAADRPFDAVRTQARAAWNRMLGRIRVGGGAREDKRRFYTQLYHSLLHPSTFSDVDGRYTGFDGAVHRSGRPRYADFSGWDTYRSQMPLVAMLAPRRASDMVRSLVAAAQESGALPKWSQANGHTHTMVGDPADLLIAGAHAFGARSFDVKPALAAMVRGATIYGKATSSPDYYQRQGLPDYLSRGYVPFERNADSVTSVFLPESVWGTASTTLEYALADFGIAQLAGAECDSRTAATFMKRAGNWHNGFDAASGYTLPRNEDGSFRAQDPASGDGFVEGNAAQYTLFVPHDPRGLFTALGGLPEARARLDDFFTELNAGPAAPHAFLGNEPTLTTPWLYTWAGQPYKAQAIVRQAMLDLYADTPAGMPGNDDLGSMASWWVMSALGLYPAVPGTDVLTVGGPLFKRADIKLPRGLLKLRAPRAARSRPFVAGLRLNGRRVGRGWLRYARLARGGKLRFKLSGAPTPRFASHGRAPSFAPRSCR